MKGKLIVIESGTDGSGKTTQWNMLYDKLVKDGRDVRKIDFPDYESPSSSLVKMYLQGEFGSDPSEISPYVASSFYTVDRYASYKTKWGSYYENGGILLANRYTTSNMVHQASKIMDRDERSKYLDWLCDFEYNIYSLPVPNHVIYLDLPIEFSIKLINSRKMKSENVFKNDIHELNEEYLRKCYLNSLEICEKYNWIRVDCLKNGELKTIEEISMDIYDIIKKIL